MRSAHLVACGEDGAGSASQDEFGEYRLLPCWGWPSMQVRAIVNDPTRDGGNTTLAK